MDRGTGGPSSSSGHGASMAPRAPWRAGMSMNHETWEVSVRETVPGGDFASIFGPDPYHRSEDMAHFNAWDLLHMCLGCPLYVRTV